MMAKKQQAPDILGRAMLVNLSISAWTARKKDREVTERTNAEHSADKDAGNYWKKLFGGRTEKLTALMSAYQALRGAHYAQTLPWTEEGWRILPTENYFGYAEVVRKARKGFDAALEDFIAAYPRLVQTARERLGDMYREADYPPAGEVRSKYGVQIDYAPLPSGGDFRVTLPEEEMRRIVRGVEERVGDAVRDAMRDAWARLGDAVSHLRDRVEDGKYLRGNLIEKVKDIAEILERLNVTQDAELERARRQVLRDLAPLDVEVLRGDADARAATVRKADAILKQMQDVYSPSKEAK